MHVLNLVVAIATLCVFAQLLDTNNAALQAHVAALIFVGIHFANGGFQKWAYESGRVSDRRKGQRECKECE